MEGKLLAVCLHGVEPVSRLPCSKRRVSIRVAAGRLLHCKGLGSELGNRLPGVTDKSREKFSFYTHTSGTSVSFVRSCQFLLARTTSSSTSTRTPSLGCCVRICSNSSAHSFRTRVANVFKNSVLNNAQVVRVCAHGSQTKREQSLGKISLSFTLKTKNKKKIHSSQRERASRIKCGQFSGLSRVFKWCRDQDPAKKSAKR